MLNRSLQRVPDQPLTLNSLGNALHDLKRPEEALACYERALLLAPDLTEAWLSRAIILRELKRQDEALVCYEHVLTLNPGLAQAWYNRGNVLSDLKRPEEALASYEQALTRTPDLADAWYNRGNVLNDLKRPEEALASYERALTLCPDMADAWCNRGKILNDLKHPEEAQACYERAIALRADYAQAWWNKSVVQLLMGDYQEGWLRYEWRWKTELFAATAAVAEKYPQLLWLGEQPLTGRTLLIRQEQGLGDYIQFIRYAPLIQQQGARVILEVPHALMTLLATLPGQCTRIPEGQPLPDFDYHCPLMSLPLACRTRLETVPDTIPYLFPDTEKQALWHQKLGPRSAFRVGLVWSGSASHKNDHNRSMPLQQLHPLLALPAEFHSLQKEVRPGDAGFMADSGRITDHHGSLHDFSDTAALLAEMDLVISIDTSVAHLAGAMGKPVWILLPWVPDYRWMLDREDSPWYGTAVLLRQPAAGDWDSVISRVCRQLAALLEDRALSQRGKALLMTASAPSGLP